MMQGPGRLYETYRQFLSFSMVGAIGFVIDSATLHFLITHLGAGLYGGRVISYVVAASFTWALNRRFTFRQERSADSLAEWRRFLVANAAGGLVNYATYAILVTYSGMIAANPVLGVAAGSVAGLAFNFSASRYFVFR